jgi:hypothetical protein
MKRRAFKGGVIATAVLLACVSVPAQAAMQCWNETQAAAAQIRDLQSRLMVATMRCRAMGINITYAYNRFVVANRSTIQGANGILRGQFRLGYGIDGEHHYDRFATALANAYGGDETDPWTCAEAEDMAYEAADARGDIGRLLHLADRLGPPPRLPGGRCGISFDELTPRTEGVAEVAQVQAQPVPAAVIDRAEASPLPRDPLDEIDEIPAPSDSGDERRAMDRPSAPLPVKPAPASKVTTDA